METTIRYLQRTGVRAPAQGDANDPLALYYQERTSQSVQEARAASAERAKVEELARASQANAVRAKADAEASQATLTTVDADAKAENIRRKQRYESFKSNLLGNGYEPVAADAEARRLSGYGLGDQGPVGIAGPKTLGEKVTQGLDAKVTEFMGGLLDEALERRKKGEQGAPAPESEFAKAERAWMAGKWKRFLETDGQPQAVQAPADKTLTPLERVLKGVHEKQEGKFLQVLTDFLEGKPPDVSAQGVPMIELGGIKLPPSAAVDVYKAQLEFQATRLRDTDMVEVHKRRAASVERIAEAISKAPEWIGKAIAEQMLGGKKQEQGTGPAAQAEASGPSMTWMLCPDPECPARKRGEKTVGAMSKTGTQKVACNTCGALVTLSAPE